MRGREARAGHREQPAAGPFVGFLHGGESRAIDAVIDRLVDELRKSLLFFGDVLGKPIHPAPTDGAESIVEHAADIV